MLESAHERERAADGVHPRRRRHGLAAHVEGETGHAQPRAQAVPDESPASSGAMCRDFGETSDSAPGFGNDRRTSTEKSDDRPRNFATSWVVGKDDEGADAPQVGAGDVGDGLDGLRVQAAADRDALSLEQVAISPRDATAKLAPKASTARITAGWGERRGREVDLRLGQLVAQRQQLGGHAVDVEHEERAACSRTRSVRRMRAAYAGELPSSELAVRRPLGARARRRASGSCG